ncbi:unnamed protein product, partial [Mesorhabditis belari]|uniref:Uncharacterized protein n=1 Tax=Mesorhabditis belari TaxID=2138241 RepID=A0AAF3J779_9BILA
MSFADDDPSLGSDFTSAPQLKLIETQQGTQPDTIAADTSVINDGSNAEPLGETRPWLNPEAETQQWNLAGKRVGRRSTMTAEEKKRDNKLRKQQRKAAVKKAVAHASVTSDSAGVNASGVPENVKQAPRQKEKERRKRKRAEANGTEAMAPQHAKQGYRQGVYGGSFARSGGLQGQSIKQARQSRPGPKRGPVTPDRRYGNTNFFPQTSGQYDNVYAGYDPSSHKRQPRPGYYDSYGEGYSGGYYNGQGYGQNQDHEGYGGYYEGYSKGNQKGYSGEYFKNDRASHNQYGEYYGSQYGDYYRQYGGYGPVDLGDEMITMRKSELAALIEKERAKERERLPQTSAAYGDQAMTLQRRQEARDAATDLLYEMLQEAGVQVQELRKREQERKRLPPGDDRGAAAVLLELLRSRRDQQHTPPPTTSQQSRAERGEKETNNAAAASAILSTDRPFSYSDFAKGAAKPVPFMEKTPVGVDGGLYSRYATPPRPPASTSADGFFYSSAINQQITPQRSLSVPPNAYSNSPEMNQQMNNKPGND